MFTLQLNVDQIRLLFSTLTFDADLFLNDSVNGKTNTQSDHSDLGHFHTWKQIIYVYIFL